MSWLVGDDEEQPGGNQLAAAALDAPLVPPTQQLLRGRVKAGTTRRHGCGVCRTCLFAPHSLPCLATKTAAAVAAADQGARSAQRKRARAAALERRLDKEQRERGEGVPHASVAQKTCRLCKCADHLATACPLLRNFCQTQQDASGDADANEAAGGSPLGTDASSRGLADTHLLRSVLLNVQQLASARLLARPQQHQTHQWHILGPAELQRIEAALCELRRDARDAQS